MKLIQAMKQVKDLQKKVEDLKTKIKTYCVDMDFEEPTYPDQAGQVRAWLQAAGDCLKQILELRVAIQRTNLATNVTIELGDKQVTKSIAEWIHRRRDLATQEYGLWASLTDRNLRDGLIQTSSEKKIETKIRRYYSPAERDVKLELYRSEPSIIDATLEVTNAVTDLIE